MAPAPFFGDLGKTARDVLYGGRDGVYQYSNVVSLSKRKGGLALTGKKVAWLNVTLSGSLPDVGSGKLGLEYVVPHVSLKAGSTLSATPLMDVAVTSNVDVKGRDLLWVDRDPMMLPRGCDKKDVSALIAHSVTPDVTVGAEIVRNLDSAETSMAAGVARRLPSGALQKVKVQHTGIVSVLHDRLWKERATGAFWTV
eukprot:jgi/Picre1/31493/NNA_006845.t1